MRSGIVSNLHADVVCENDTFTVDRGEIKEHKINYREPRGKVYAAYAICRFKDGSEKSEVMTKEEVDAIRGRSRAGNSGPWVSDYNEMAKKTVFRRLSKWLPLSPEERDAVESDDSQFENRTIEVAKPIFGVAAPTPAIEAAPLESGELTEAEKASILARENAEATNG
jgi:recombination protein RecT